jgi:acetate kinase
LREHKLLDSAVAKELEAAIEFAPLHLPSSLAVLKAAQEKLPGIPQAICLDTAFHRNMPEVSRTYALPEKIRKLGVERYGFHGLSLESIVAQLQSVPERLVVAHLGNGASVTAILKGVSIDTSMGLTPTGGVMMGTRCGDLDPGLVPYLMRHGYAQAEQLEQIFDRESGLLGISGTTRDVRTLLETRAQNKQAALALEMFCYQVRKTIAGMSAALGGAATLVFTGGIGEHASSLREEICAGLKFLSSSELDVRVLPSQEDEQIAKNTVQLLNAAQ